MRTRDFRRLKATAAGVLALTALGAAADSLFGVYAGFGTWNQEISGDLAAGGEAIDVDDELGFEDENNQVMYFALETGVPLVPNLRLQKVDVELSGSDVLRREIDFNGTSFSLDQAVATDVEVDQTDAILYWQLLDNVVSLDLGFGARWTDGHVALATPFEVSRAEFEAVMPMLYGRGRVDLPFSGGWVAVALHGLSYEGDRLYELTAQVGWESPWGLGIEGGWRKYEFDVEAYDEIDVAAIEVSGPYAALNFHF